MDEPVRDAETDTHSAVRVRETIERIYAAGATQGDHGTYQIGTASVTPDRGRFVRDMCRAARAHTSVETGMAWGLSTLHILEALIENGAGPSAHVVMDPGQSSQYHNAALHAVRAAAAEDLVEFHEQPSEFALPRMVREGRRFDFGFIDGNHDFEHAYLDFAFINRMLNPGGIVVFDDVPLYPVCLTCEIAETVYGYTLVRQHFGDIRNKQKRRTFGLRSPLAPLAWMRAYRKPTARPAEGFKFSPLYLGLPWYRRYASHILRSQGLRALARGNRREARHAFFQALHLAPDRLRTYSCLARTFLPRPIANALSSKRK
jgi:predicted O-methyltransferase YrrM